MKTTLAGISLCVIAGLPVSLGGVAAPGTRPAAAAATAPAATASQPVATRQISEKDDGNTVTLSPGVTAAISLPANATTGYSWSVAKIEGDAAEQVGDIQYSGNVTSGAVGSGGTAVATFRAVKAGKVTITLAYARPWEKNVPPAKTFTVTLEINALK